MIATFTPSKITLTEADLTNFKELVVDELKFVDPDGVEWLAPLGTLTDGASVPRFALVFTDGRWDESFLKAAVVHDAYCQEENKTRCPDQYRKKRWKTVHRMFYDACVAGRTPRLKAKMMYAAVRLAGPRWDIDGQKLPAVPEELAARGFAGSKNTIEQNDSTLDEIDADLDKREPLLMDLHKHERKIIDALLANDSEKANQLLQEEGTLLDTELTNSPNDLMLLNFQGYWHKNQAQVSRREGNVDRMEKELELSEATFNKVIDVEPVDASALNGLGSVSMLRGDWDRAEKLVRQAIEINPDYEAAQYDLKTIEREGKRSRESGGGHNQGGAILRD